MSTEQPFEVVVRVDPGHINYPSTSSLIFPSSTAKKTLSNECARSLDSNMWPLNEYSFASDITMALLDFVDADQILDEPSQTSSPEQQIYDFFRPTEYDMDADPYDLEPLDHANTERKNPFVAHSQEAWSFGEKNAIDFAALSFISPKMSGSTTEGTSTTRYVQRSMLEKPKKRRRRPLACSLSVRVPGSVERQIIQIEEVPVLCKRLKIRHSSVQFEVTLQLPQIMLTARKKRCHVPSIDTHKGSQTCTIASELETPAPLKRKRGRPRKSATQNNPFPVVNEVRLSDEVTANLVSDDMIDPRLVKSLPPGKRIKENEVTSGINIELEAQRHYDGRHLKSLPAWNTPSHGRNTWHLVLAFSRESPVWPSPCAVGNYTIV